MPFTETDKKVVFLIACMLVGRTVKARIMNPTSRKKQLLEKEYGNAQEYVSGESENLYSATKQAMDKYAEKTTQKKNPYSSETIHSQ